MEFDQDQLNSNAAVHVSGVSIGRFQVYYDPVTTDALQPSKELFGLQRLQVCALIHRR